MAKKQKTVRNWDSFNGFTKEDLVQVSDKNLNSYLMKHGVDKGRVVAFNQGKNLVLVEFRQLTYEKPGEGVRYPMKWVPIDEDLTKIIKDETMAELPNPKQ